MSKGARWLVGGLLSGFLLAGAAFVLIFGSIWFTVGNVAKVLDGRSVTGTIIAVNVPAPYAPSASQQPAPSGSGTRSSGGTGDAGDAASDLGVTVRYVPIDSHDTALPEVTAWAAWTGANTPAVNDQVPVSYLYLSPSAPTEAGGAISTEVVGQVGSGFRDAGSGILVVGFVLAALALIGFVATAVWASRAPAQAPVAILPGYGPPIYGPPGYIPPGPYPPQPPPPPFDQR